jgi:phosphatidate cytidylyltransferase
MDKNLVTRALTGSVYVIITLAAMYFGAISAGLYLLIISIFCLYEWYKLTEVEKNPLALPHLIGGALFVAGAFSYFSGLLTFMEPIWMIFPLSMIFWIFSRNTTANDWAKLMGGMLYTLLPFVLFYSIAFDESGAFDGSLLLMIFVLVWSTDTFAYLVGRMIGKHKLAPHISPGKSWEGLVGGIVGSVVVALLFYKYYDYYEPWFYIFSAIIVAVFGVLGDLFESKLKRLAGVKDSGKMLPGHGGFLDRFDSLLLVAPPFYVFYQCYLYYLQ